MFCNFDVQIVQRLEQIIFQIKLFLIVLKPSLINISRKFCFILTLEKSILLCELLLFNFPFTLTYILYSRIATKRVSIQGVAENFIG